VDLEHHTSTAPVEQFQRNNVRKASNSMKQAKQLINYE